MNRFFGGLCALAVLAVQANWASAGWDNVFQTSSAPGTMPGTVTGTLCCDHCKQPAPVPQPQCTTQYVQRCFYQPVTTYQSQTYYEPVTTYSKSYYYEQVTNYHTSMYRDPCTGCSQQLFTPVTSYQLREKVSPVQSWVQRCGSVPVTTYQKSCYLEPQTTCCQTTVGALIPLPGNGSGQHPGAMPGAAMGPGGGGLPQGMQPSVAEQRSYSSPGPVIQEQRSLSPQPPPVIQEQRSLSPQPPPVIQEQRSLSPQPPPVIQEERTPGAGMRFSPQWQPKPPPAAPPAVKLDRIALAPDAPVEGQVLRNDKTPRANTKVLFVNASNLANRQMVTANTSGQFRVTLPAGGWFMYLENPDGTHGYHSRLDVNGQTQTARITLVSR